MALIVGAYRLLTYTLPMLVGNYQTAYDSWAADESVVLYDAALSAYEEQNYSAASILLQEAGSQMVAADGTVPASRNDLAARIHFLHGNALVKLKKPDLAIEQYEAALRKNPAHLWAKYNLELLHKPPVGNSGNNSGPGVGNQGGQGNTPNQGSGTNPADNPAGNSPGQDNPSTGQNPSQNNNGQPSDPNQPGGSGAGRNKGKKI